MNSSECDLIVRGGRVVCPATGFDGPGAVAIQGNRITQVGQTISGAAAETLDFPSATILPGLVDLHAHPGAGFSKFGVDPDIEFLPRGVTTVLSQGDTGSRDWNEYRASAIENSKTRVRMALNLSSTGESNLGGCFQELQWADVDACVKTIEDGGDLIWGIAVNVSVNACDQTDPKEVMRRGLEVARQTNRPILYGIRNPKEWSFDEQMALLRPHDVMTYLYRSGDWSIVDENRRVHPALREARKRGVLFDIGHGMGSLVFDVAEAAIADGFPPDTISSDQYARHVGLIPQHDLARTMSKLLAAGMPERDVFSAVTDRPAKILGMESEIGRLSPGTSADVTVLDWNEAAAPLTDVEDNERPGGCWEAICTIRAGEVIQR